MQKFLLLSGGALAAAAVMLGAFGAHALKAKLDAGQLQVFETGVRYQMYHSLAIILAASFYGRFNTAMLNATGYAFIIGILLFSGSLYLLSMKNLLGIEGWKFLGPVTPVGGLSFIVGWLLFINSIIKN